MQTSKADGMFTEDQYLDFLNHEHVLKSPLENFVPSAQKQAELFYTSSLLDPARTGVGELRQPMAAEPAGSMRPEAASSFRPGAAMEETAGRRDPMGTTARPDDADMSSGSHYVIDDETPLSEVVAQMYDSPDQLDKLLRQAAAMESEDQGDQHQPGLILLDCAWRNRRFFRETRFDQALSFFSRSARRRSVSSRLSNPMPRMTWVKTSSTMLRPFSCIRVTSVFSRARVRSE